MEETIDNLPVQGIVVLELNLLLQSYVETLRSFLLLVQLLVGLGQVVVAVDGQLQRGFRGKLGRSSCYVMSLSRVENLGSGKEWNLINKFWHFNGSSYKLGRTLS